MENRDILNDNIQAASTIDPIYHPAWYARLNGDSCWSGTGTTAWIQADIGYQTYVSGVVTQGDGAVGEPHWVTSIKVSTFPVSSEDKDTEVFVKDGDGNHIVSILMLRTPHPTQPYTWIRIQSEG